MRIRNLAHRTIDAYTLHAARFADFIQKPLDCATVEDVRNFQLYLSITKNWPTAASIKPLVCYGFSTPTIRVPWPVTTVPFGKRPKTLAVVLGRQEVTELLACLLSLDLVGRVFLGLSGRLMR